MRPPLPKRVRHSELRPRSLLIHTPVILSTRPAPSREAKAGRSDSRAHCRNEARRTLLPFGRAHRSRLGAVARARWRPEFPACWSAVPPFPSQPRGRALPVPRAVMAPPAPGQSLAPPAGWHHPRGRTPGRAVKGESGRLCRRSPPPRQSAAPSPPAAAAPAIRAQAPQNEIPPVLPADRPRAPRPTRSKGRLAERGQIQDREAGPVSRRSSATVPGSFTTIRRHLRRICPREGRGPSGASIRREEHSSVRPQRPPRQAFRQARHQAQLRPALQGDDGFRGDGGLSRGPRHAYRQSGAALAYSATVCGHIFSRCPSWKKTTVAALSSAGCGVQQGHQARLLPGRDAPFYHPTLPRCSSASRAERNGTAVRCQSEGEEASGTPNAWLSS